MKRKTKHTPTRPKSQMTREQTVFAWRPVYAGLFFTILFLPPIVQHTHPILFVFFLTFSSSTCWRNQKDGSFRIPGQKKRILDLHVNKPWMRLPSRCWNQWGNHTNDNTARLGLAEVFWLLENKKNPDPVEIKSCGVFVKQKNTNKKGGKYDHKFQWINKSITQNPLKKNELK